MKKKSLSEKQLGKRPLVLPHGPPFQNNAPRKFIAHYDAVKVLKQISKEIGVFCLRMLNSIKRGNHY